ncbi:hypothetical protein ACM66B_005603 [Microbotryomycetes sp. NB124-2]
MATATQSSPPTNQSDVTVTIPASTDSRQPEPASIESSTSTTAATAAHAAPQQQTRKVTVRHGRGPLIRDSDDDYDEDDEAQLGTQDEQGLDESNEHSSLLGRRRINKFLKPRTKRLHKRHDDNKNDDDKRKSRASCTTTRCLCTTLIIVVTLLLALIAVLHVWIGHVMGRHQTYAGPEQFRKGLIVRGPYRLDIDAPVGSVPGPIIVEADLEIGFDVRKALGWQGRQRTGSWLEKTEDKLARWTIRNLGHVRVSVSEVEVQDTERWENYFWYNQSWSVGPPPEEEGQERREGLDNWFCSSECPESSSIMEQETWQDAVEDEPAYYADELGKDIPLSEAHELEPAPTLIVVHNMSDIVVPLSYLSDNDDVDTVKVERVTIRVPVDVPDPDAVRDVLHNIWKKQRYHGFVNVKSSVTFLGTDARGVAGTVAKWLGKRDLYDVQVTACGKLPHMPEASDPASLVNVTTIDVKKKRLPTSVDSNGDKVLGVSISATVKNPLLDVIKQGKLAPFAFGLPFSIPVAVSLPLPRSRSVEGDDSQNSTAAAVVAQLVVEPFSFKAGAHSTTVAIKGHLVPPPTSSSATRSSPFVTALDDSNSGFSSALSKLFARYLKGKPNLVLVSYDSKPVDLDQGDQRHLPPDVVKRIVNDVQVEVEVPGSQEKLQLFKDLRIEDMKIKLAGMVSTPLHLVGLGRHENGDDGGGDLLCSGKVVGEVNLPEMFKGVAELLDVREIWPDVYVYDGALPDGDEQNGRRQRRSQIAFLNDDDDNRTESDARIVRVQGQGDDEDDDDASSYPPRPIPATAFARLYPSSSISATTAHVPPNSTYPSGRTIISATFTDAPLYLLPGRSDVFRRFVGRILFGGPGAKTKAGVRGVTSIRVGVNSWGQVQVEKMPVEGEFMVGAGGVSEGS